MRQHGIQYYKRFRMELDLRRWRRPHLTLDPQYRLVPWDPTLTAAHAEVKCDSFRGELDEMLFPCLGQYDGCLQLMEDIESREGFLPEATWLVESLGPGKSLGEYCGTIQTIRAHRNRANIQNVGVSPAHRNRGIGKALIAAVALGLVHLGIRRVSLEVTAENHAAVNLYRQMGFRTVRTLYKAVKLEPVSLLAD